MDERQQVLFYFCSIALQRSRILSLLFIPCLKCIIRFMYVFMPQEAIRYPKKLTAARESERDREREKGKPIKQMELFHGTTNKCGKLKREIKCQTME